MRGRGFWVSVCDGDHFSVQKWPLEPVRDSLEQRFVEARRGTSVSIQKISTKRGPWENKNSQKTRSERLGAPPLLFQVPSRCGVDFSNCAAVDKITTDAGASSFWSTAAFLRSQRLYAEVDTYSSPNLESIYLFSGMLAIFDMGPKVLSPQLEKLSE